MNKEPSWTEAATKVLEMEGKVWMSVPDLIKALQKTKIKTIESAYGQACRNLRSALKHHTRKENGMFAQKQDNMRVLYALRKHLKSKSVPKTSNRTPTPSWPQASNGDAEMSSDTDVDSSSQPDYEPPRKRAVKSTCSLMVDPADVKKDDATDIALTDSHTLGFSTASMPTTVEIDPTHCKPQRGREGVSPFCLPSPLSSILGPRRTLNMLSETVLPTLQRPMRSVRQKRGSVAKAEEDPVQVNGPPSLPLSPLHPALVGVVSPEEQSSVNTLETDIAFVKTEWSGDPTLVQGDRPCCIKVEVSSDGITSDESDNDDEDESGMASENGETAILLQPTPASQLLRRRSLVTRIPFHETQRCSEESVDRHPQAKLRTAPEFVHPRYSHRSYSFAAGEMRPPRKSEVSRIISSLFSSTSPIIGENLKLLLNHTAFAGLTESQRREVVKKLPSVDRQGGTQLAEGSLSNSFLSSTMREWQERLASGMFASEYRTRVRSEEKRRGSVKPEEAWKQQYYEEQYGDSQGEPLESSFTPYFPTSEHPELHSKCLHAIRHSWNNTPDSPSPVAPTPSHTPPNEEVSPVKLSPPVGSDQRNHGRSRNIVPVVLRHSVSKSQRTMTGRANKIHAKLNRTLSKSHKPAAKELLKRLKGPPTHHNLSQTIFRSLLTPLPPNTSYNSLLVSLRNENRVTMPTTCQYLPASPQNHPVFHDHFSLLSSHHVPEEFCEPVTSLPLRIPREYHTACMQCRISQLEHSYAGASPPSLSVSLPRSLLASECVCNNAPLIYCQLCQSLYHGSCTRTCPGCRA